MPSDRPQLLPHSLFIITRQDINSANGTVIRGQIVEKLAYSPCEMRPPSSVTTPLRSGKYGLQPTSVLCVMRISPCFNSSICSRLVTTHARPITVPEYTDVPCRRSPDIPGLSDATKDSVCNKYAPSKKLLSSD